MLELLKVIFLGIVEGITEWLPISSTGHMILVDEFVKLDVSKDFMDFFLYAIQLGAILAVVVLYWPKLWPFAKKQTAESIEPQKKQTLLPLGSLCMIKVKVLRMWFKVVVAVIPSILIALPFDDWMEEHFYNAFTVAVMLILYGVFYILLENRNRTQKIKPHYRSLGALTYKTAFLIGCFQALSIIPGTSRSGSTILGAMILGCSRSLAAEFSFFMAIPTMLGASLLKLVKFGLSFTGIELVYLVLGMAVAFLVSYLAIKFLMSYIKQHDFKVFGYYRIVLGIIVLFYFGIRTIFFL